MAGYAEAMNFVFDTHDILPPSETHLLLLRAGYTHVPYLSLESIVEQYKDGSYRALRATQKSLNGSEPDWLPWLEFFLLTLWRQVTGLARKIETLQSALQNLSAPERQLLDLLEQNGILTIAMAVAETGANCETVRKRIAGLVTKGAVTPLVP